jgi:hypothetical protein
MENDFCTSLQLNKLAIKMRSSVTNNSLKDNRTSLHGTKINVFTSS